MPCRRVRTSVEQLEPFERGHFVGLQEAEFAVEDLSLSRTAALVRKFAVKNQPFGRLTESIFR